MKINDVLREFLLAREGEGRFRNNRDICNKALTETLKMPDSTVPLLALLKAKGEPDDSVLSQQLREASTELKALKEKLHGLGRVVHDKLIEEWFNTSV